MTAAVAAAAVTSTIRAQVIEWTLADAAAEFPALSELAEKHGFRLSMFGSVLNKGEGDDLGFAALAVWKYRAKRGEISRRVRRDFERRPG